MKKILNRIADFGWFVFIVILATYHTIAHIIKHPDDCEDFNPK